jgi:hypothetical protein
LVENNLKEFSDRITEFQKLLTQAFASRKKQAEKASLLQAILARQFRRAGILHCLKT